MFRKSYEAYSNLSRDFSDKMFFIEKSRYLHYGRGFSRSEYSTRFLFVFRTVWYRFSPWGAADSLPNLKFSSFYRKTADFRDFGFRVALATANPRSCSDTTNLRSYSGITLQLREGEIVFKGFPTALRSWSRHTSR